MSAPQTPSIRVLILRILIVCMLPSVFGGVYLVAIHLQERRQEIKANNIALADALALKLDQTFLQIELAATLLAQAPAIKEGDLARFYRHAQNSIARTHWGGEVIVSDAQGQQLLNTRVAYGAELPRYANPAQVQSVFERGRTVVSDVFTGAVSGRRVLAVAVPVVRQGEVIYAVIISLTPSKLSEALGLQSGSKDWSVSIYDRNGAVAAASEPLEDGVEKKATAEQLAQFAQTPQGSYEFETQDGTPMLGYFGTAGESRWHVARSVSRRVLESNLVSELAWLVSGLVFMLGSGLLVAAVLSRQIARSVERLAMPVNDMLRGKVGVRPVLYFREALEVFDSIADIARKLGQKTAQADAALADLRRSELALRDLNRDLEAKVAQRTQDLEDLYELAPVGYHTLDAEGRITSANRAQLDLLGYAHDDYVGRHYTDLLEVQTQAQVVEFLSLAKSGVQVRQLEARLISKSGALIPVLVSMNFSLDASGRIAAARSIFVDNRVNLAHQQELERLNHFLGDVVESLPSGLVVLDSKHKVVLQNALFGRLLDYPPALIGRADLGLADLVQFSHDRGDYPNQEYGQVLSRYLAMLGNRDCSRFERRQTTGTYLAISCHRIAADWALLSYTDITREKMAMRSMEDSMREAEAANRAKSDFLSNISHELRTPLNAVIGLSDLLVQSPLNQRQQNYASKIGVAANLLKTLINDVLDLSKIEANAVQVEHTGFSMHALLSTVAGVMGVGVADHAFEPVVDVAADVPDRVLGDATRLQQILLNLVSNAVKFTQAGEIVLSVRRLSPNGAREGAQVTLEFRLRDTGIGIGEEAQTRIFESFTQAHPSITRLYGGTGLGLAISARLAGLMGGKIEMHSVLGMGTEFCLTLPLALDRETFAAPSQDDLPTGLQVLIVDDHPLVRDVLAQRCRELGWQPLAVDTGAAALQALADRSEAGRSYDLMLLDWRMPGMDGLEMLGASRQAAIPQCPAVVLMVGFPDVELATAASAGLHVSSTTFKPLTIVGLRREARAALSGESQSLTSPAIRQTLAGLHLLVAEDNGLNQEVIEQILTHAGARVTLVDTGQRAIEALQAEGAYFDAVLMDLQMPVMDGYTATKVIRNSLGWVDLPIIALSAFAQPKDREQSRQAGMSAHLTKPLDTQQVLQAVRDAVGWRAAPHTRDTPPAPATQEGEPALNLAQASEAFGDDPAVYVALLQKFMAAQAPCIAQARRCVEAGDGSAAAALIHGLCGMSGLLQLHGLSWLAQRTESALSRGDMGDVEALFAQLDAAMVGVGASIERFGAAHGD